VEVVGAQDPIPSAHQSWASPSLIKTWDKLTPYYTTVCTLFQGHLHGLQTASRVEAEMEEALGPPNVTIPSCCKRVWVSQDLVTCMMTALVTVPHSSPSTCIALANPHSIFLLSSCHHLVPEWAGHGEQHEVGLEWWRGRNRSQ
jgi:hypothetical protein